MMWEGNGPLHHELWGAGGWFMGIGMLVAVVAAVVLVVLLVKLLSQPHPAAAGQAAATAAYPETPPAQTAPAAPGAETAREIVQRRYAAGEIDREEYLQKLADL